MPFLRTEAAQLVESLSEALGVIEDLVERRVLESFEEFKRAFAVAH